MAQAVEICPKIVICDIEGTTTSINFVKETLFKYAKDHVKDFLISNWGKEETKELILSLTNQSKEDVLNKIEGVVEIPDKESEQDTLIDAIVRNVNWQIEQDRKTGALKELQGRIWELGYNSGVLKGHVYEDVPKAFKKWISDGIKIYIYSSGSVAAQKLLFSKSECGDLLPNISGHFDTKVGTKQDKQSYLNILEELKHTGEDVIFFTDIVNEAKAAKDAGVKAVLLDRPGNNPFTETDKANFEVITSFDNITINSTSIDNGKRKNQESTEEIRAAKVAKTDDTISDKSDIISNSDEKIDKDCETKKDFTTKTEDSDKMEVDIEKCEEEEKTHCILQKTEVNNKEKTEEKLDLQVNKKIESMELCTEKPTEIKELNGKEGDEPKESAAQCKESIQELESKTEDKGNTTPLKDEPIDNISSTSDNTASEDVKKSDNHIQIEKTEEIEQKSNEEENNSIKKDLNEKDDTDNVKVDEVKVDNVQKSKKDCEDTNLDSEIAKKIAEPIPEDEEKKNKPEGVKPKEIEKESTLNNGKEEVNESPVIEKIQDDLKTIDSVTENASLTTSEKSLDTDKETKLTVKDKEESNTPLIEHESAQKDETQKDESQKDESQKNDIVAKQHSVSNTIVEKPAPTEISEKLDINDSAEKIKAQTEETSDSEKNGHLTNGKTTEVVSVSKETMESAQAADLNDSDKENDSSLVETKAELPASSSETLTNKTCSEPLSPSPANPPTAATSVEIES